MPSMKKVVFPVLLIAMVLLSVLLSYSEPIFRKNPPAAIKGGR